MEKMLWIDLLKLSSIPLRKLNSEMMPESSASGCIINYAGKRVLLTVQHAVGTENWAVESEYLPDRGMTALLPLGQINFLKKIDVNSLEVTDVDLAFVEIPPNFKSVLQEVDVRGQILSERPRTTCKVDFDLIPASGDIYGFAGQVKFVRTETMFFGNIQVYPGLTFDRVEEDLYYFKLPIKHPGHDFFHGCSGAPIIDTNANTVALVCGGIEDTNEIYGISLRHYEPFLQAEYRK